MNWLTQFTTGMLSAGILLSTTIAPASAAKFTFEQDGFFSKFVGAGVPEFPYTPGGMLTGQFSGDDIDGDEILSLNELTSFSADIYLGFREGVRPDYLTNFAYNLSSGVLKFSAFFGSSIFLDSSQSFTSGFIKGGTASGVGFFSNAPITIREVAAPVSVPEPATIIGLGTLVLLSFSSKARRFLQ